jgi:hypothetical protein
LCDYDTATNFGVIVGEVILVDSCAMIVIYFIEKKETNFLLALVLYSMVELLFKIYFLVELGLSLLFPEGKQRSELD